MLPGQSACRQTVLCSLTIRSSSSTIADDGAGSGSPWSTTADPSTSGWGQRRRGAPTPASFFCLFDANAELEGRMAGDRREARAAGGPGKKPALDRLKCPSAAFRCPGGSRSCVSVRPAGAGLLNLDEVARMNIVDAWKRADANALGDRLAPGGNTVGPTYSAAPFS
jgi:hypothetical protein